MSTTLFAHPAARLIKHIPPLDAPHINASLRRDLLGAGTTRGTEQSLGVVLADHQGPLQVCSVPDPSMPGLATLVLVVDAQEQNSVFGAQRRAVVPFRLFEQTPLEGAPGLPGRRVYEGLGAGKHGVDGGSLWFVEDEREEGAMDRLRWSNLGRGNRAVWTIWLMGAPAPVVAVLGELLEVHPRPITKLPPMLEDSFPWRDTYIALPQSQLIIHQQQQQGEEVDSANTSAESDEAIIVAAAAAPAPTARRNAPPAMPPKPAALRSGTLTSPNTSIEAHQLASIAPFTPSSIDAPAAAAAVPKLGTLRNAPRTRTQRSSASSGSAATPDYRHSLVAVDHETGQILGILAQDVRLEQDQQEEEEGGGPPGSSASEEELVTPLDGAPLGLLSTNTEVEKEMESGSATPKQASIRRAVGVYYDSVARREASRASSVLPLDTFAPPPVPDKGTLLSLPPNVNVKKEGETVRDSMASAAFFSAAESGDEEDLLAPPEQEEEEGWARVHARHTSSHRPDLLRDVAKEDEDARSDVSGSTVGGPAVRLWRKARGLPKIKPGGAAKQMEEVPRRRDGSGQRSEDSVRTSRAETAMEELESDAEEEEEAEEITRRFSVLDPLRSASQEAEDNEEEQDNTIMATSSVEADESQDALAHMRTSTSASGIAVKLHGHRSRALMGSSEVRSREDQLWRDAFDTEALPIDAPYTHLTTPPATAANEPGAAMERTMGNATKISEEGMEMQTKGERATSPDSSSSSAAAAPRTNAALQGGTVLIEFLQGSRIGASILSGPAASLLAATDGVASPPSLEVAPLRKGAMAYIPVLPSHFLWWLGIGEEEARPTVAAAAESDATAKKQLPNVASSSLTQVGPDLSAVLSRSGAVEALTSVTSSFSSALSGLASSAGWLFGGGAWSSTTSSSSADEGEAGLISDADRDADAAEWEWAVPDFHPDSLASTPRPIYRRRRPVPSPTAGFAVRQISESEDPAKLMAQPGARELVGSKGMNGTQRYSIIHYDAQGVGRRAFLSAAAGGPPVGLGGLF